jgi:phage gp29-like protein
VLQGLQEADARSLALTIYQQIARPFAAMNFGNPDIAPRVVWDVTPFEDAKTKALAFMQIAEALNFMRVAGFKMDPRNVRRMIRDTIPGFDTGGLLAIEPLAVETAAIGAKVKPSEGKPEDGKPREDARTRIGAIMQRIDPRLGERARIAAARFEASEDEGLAEAMAEIEAGMVQQRRSRR